MKRLLVLLFTLTLVGSAGKADVWKADKVHSSVQFSVSHLVISEVVGKFKDFDATLTNEKSDFTDGAISATVSTNSISTDNDQRDTHLKSDAFFNAEKFPTMSFKSTAITKVDDQHYSITGLLTIRDVTKSVTFDAVYKGTIVDAYKKTRSAWSAVTTINRFDYNLNWNALLEAGGAVVGKDVKITLTLELVKS